MFAGCEAGTRRGHYSGYSLIVRWLRTLERASLLSGGGLLHALHIIRLFAACEAGTRHGHYSGYSFLVLACGLSSPARRDARSSVRKRRTIDGLTICYVYQRTTTTAYDWVVRWCEDESPTQSNRTQPVGTLVRASAEKLQGLLEQSLQRTLERASLQLGCVRN